MARPDQNGKSSSVFSLHQLEVSLCPEALEFEATMFKSGFNMLTYVPSLTALLTMYMYYLSGSQQSFKLIQEHALQSLSKSMALVAEQM